jgi:hypothetical protein
MTKMPERSQGIFPVTARGDFIDLDSRKFEMDRAVGKDSAERKIRQLP